MDLSKVLGDVYESTDRVNGPGPDWSNEDRLDEAFADWTPGPHESAPQAEHDVLGLDDELATTLSAALTAPEVAPAAAEPAPEPLPEPAPAAVVARAWQRSDDDILPGKPSKPAKGGRRHRH